MISRTAAVLLAASFSLQLLPISALAENQMGYRLLSAVQSADLPRSGGSIGMDVGRAQQITSGGMTFDLLLVNGVQPSSPAAQAGFKVGDQIIAVDQRVFASVAVFAAYVGSVQPGRLITVDYMPSGGGPQQAQRVPVTVGAGGRTGVSPPKGGRAPSTGLSTGTKLAIGIGAVALFGCYEIDCFSRSTTLPSPPAK